MELGDAVLLVAAVVVGFALRPIETAARVVLERRARSSSPSDPPITQAAVARSAPVLAGGTAPFCLCGVPGARCPTHPAEEV